MSIIIPLGPAEKNLESLLLSLQKCPTDWEIFFIQSKSNNPEAARANEILRHHKLKWIRGDDGRANLLNLGAARATGKFLWFLHADSIFAPSLIPDLIRNLEHNPQALWFFKLAFLEDGGQAPMIISELGTRLRSTLMGIPFGDQGFVISKANFQLIGGYDEQTEYGEDHLFAWKARQLKIPLKVCKSFLFTSARKYHEYGWASVVWKYLRLWTGQALPEIRLLLKSRGIV